MCVCDIGPTCARYTLRYNLDGEGKAVNYCHYPHFGPLDRFKLQIGQVPTEVFRPDKES